MTIEENLDLLEQTKASIGTAIINKGGNVTNVEFSGYPAVIDSLVDQNFIKTMNGRADTIVIPEGVTQIKPYLFSGDTTLKYCTVPSTVTKIGNYAFYETGIRQINIPDGVTEIGNAAFNGCYSFSGTSGTTVVIPDSCKTIGVAAFANNNNIRTIIIGSGCTSIGANAFEIGNSTSTKLKNLYCYAVTPPRATSIFLNSAALPDHIYVPAESVDTYKNTAKWSTYATKIQAIPA